MIQILSRNLLHINAGPQVRRCLFSHRLLQDAQNNDLWHMYYPDAVLNADSVDVEYLIDEAAIMPR